MTETFPLLPALRSLGTLADVRPKIVIDSREQAPLRFTRLESISAALHSGDYSFAGAEEVFAVERKSVADLVSCCTGDNRERFERELHRLRGFRFKRLLIVGTREEVLTRRYHSGVKPKAVLASLAAWEVRYDVPIAWASDPEDAARMIEGWTWWFSRELVAMANQLCRASKWEGATGVAAQSR